MRHGRFVYVVGDVHGNFGELNKFINLRIRQDRSLRSIAARWNAEGNDLRALILQCGDFAWFWGNYEAKGEILNQVDFMQEGCVPVYWIGGNHEDWDALDRLDPGITRIDSSVYYCAFGSVMWLAPDTSALFAGGAESHDIEWRLLAMAQGEQKIWWEQEGIGAQDVERLENVERADWVISHTAPTAFDCYAQPMFEPSRCELDKILHKYHPKRWFFGHFHTYAKGVTDGCAWECLSELGDSKKSWQRIFLEWED